MRRFFIDESKRSEDLVTIDGDEFFHMSTVLRINEKETIEICFNDGIVWIGKFVEFEKKHATVRLISSYESNAEATAHVTVFQALAKGDKMDLITQKLTELGVFSMVPFESQFTVVKISSNISRLQKVAIQSSKQCGRAIAMNTEEAIDFDAMCERLKDFELVIFANETEEKNSLSKLLAENKGARNVAIIVGSEGGFAPEEIEKIIASKAQSITLGKRILRCETAAIAVSAIVMYSLNELGGEQ